MIADLMNPITKSDLPTVVTSTGHAIVTDGNEIGELACSEWLRESSERAEIATPLSWSVRNLRALSNAPRSDSP